MQTKAIQIWAIVAYGLVLLFLGVLLGYAVFSFDRRSEPEMVFTGRRYSLREFPVLEISAKDGDTFAVSLDLGFDMTIKQSLRIFGVDAPESSTDAGKQVTELAKRWIKDRSCIVRFRKEDKYGGRFDGDLVGDGEEYSEYLLENKLAREYSGAKRTIWTTGELAAIATRAKKALEQP